MARFQNITIESIKIVAESLEKEINRRNIQLWMNRFRYYLFDDPSISDIEYDKKEYEYKLLRENNPHIEPKYSCPLSCIGTDADQKTTNKVMEILKYIQSEKKEAAETKQPAKINEQLSLFSTSFAM